MPNSIVWPILCNKLTENKCKGKGGGIHSSNIQDQFRHTNSQNTFQEVVNKEMTVCEYGLQLGVCVIRLV